MLGRVIFVLLLVVWGSSSSSSSPRTINANTIADAPVNDIIDADLTVFKTRLMKMVEGGAYLQVIADLEEFQEIHGHLAVDRNKPSLYSIKGVAYHGLFEHDKAIEAFTQAVHYYPDETRAWINLGETYQLKLQVAKSIEAFQAAVDQGDITATMRLLSAKGWAADWHMFENITAQVEHWVRMCDANRQQCPLDSTIGLEYIHVSGEMVAFLHTKIPNAQASDRQVPISRNEEFLSTSKRSSPRSVRRLKVGLISSDFGVHPVSSLIRGMVELIDKSHIELFCFSITRDSSWWGDNIAGNCEHIVYLESMNTYDAASSIASMQVEILIDLNGLTKNSGLPYMSHRPAPVQISYLGLPTTTGASSFIDYYIGDYVALPPEHSNQFVETLALLHPSYIVSDYRQTMGDIPEEHAGTQRAHRSILDTDDDISSDITSLLFGTLSNSQKMDPVTFQVWMNILRRFGGSKLAVMSYTPARFSTPNLRRDARGYGILPDRIVNVSQADWLYHVYSKTSIDMMLDTTSKNGHTTGLDGVWAGVPTVSLGGGSSMPKRAAESIAAALGSELGISYSMKEYEDIVFAYAHRQSKRTMAVGAIKKICEELLMESSDDEAIEYCYEAAMLERSKLSGHEKLGMWRKHVESLRTQSRLFNTASYTREFTYLLQAIWETSRIAHISSLSSNQRSAKRFHVFPSSIPASVIPRERMKQAVDGGRALRTKERVSPDYSEDVLNYKLQGHTPHVAALHPKHYSPLLPDIFDGRAIMLNIGGIHSSDGWLIVNSQSTSIGGKYDGAADTVIRNMYDLQGFPDRSVSVIYSSHTLEHSGPGDHTLIATMQEWHRVLKPNGMALIAVPDLRTILRLYLTPGLALNDKYMLTNMIYGAQSDPYDFHMIGFDEDTLAALLSQYGFCDMQRVTSFGLFSDSSEISFLNYRISLNMVARKCPTAVDRPEDHVHVQMFDMTPYDPTQYLS